MNEKKLEAKTLTEWHVITRKKGEFDCGTCYSIGTKYHCSDCKQIQNKSPKFVSVDVLKQKLQEIIEDLRRRSMITVYPENFAYDRTREKLEKLLGLLEGDSK